jgi:hypothetical protein
MVWVYLKPAPTATLYIYAGLTLIFSTRILGRNIERLTGEEYQIFSALVVRTAIRV